MGHTPGSIALLYDDPSGHPHLFTGDCLFPGGSATPSRTTPKFATLIDDVGHKLSVACPARSGSYPGHAGGTTLGTERPSLAIWRDGGW